MWVAGNVEWTGVDGARNDAGWVGICVTVVAVSERIDELVGEGLCVGALLVVVFDDGEDREQSRSRWTRPLAEETGGTVFATGFTTSFATGFTARGKRGGVAEISVDLQRTGGDEHTLSAGDCTVRRRRWRID